MHEHLRNRIVPSTSTFAGIERFCLGLAKKVLIADPLGQVAHITFAQESVPLSFGLAWVGLLCFSMQIYFDFSGYSDMAIGLGRVFGFTFPENFRRPYLSKSITEFWHRWHITLSNWMRDYLYIPLGGNRCSMPRVLFNLWLTFLLSGLWHGAEWTFILWGAYHGFFLTVERGLRSSRYSFPPLLSWALSFLIVLISWVLFRCSSLAHVGEFVSRLLGQSVTETYTLQLLSNHQWATLLVAVLLCFSPPIKLSKYAASLQDTTDLRFAFSLALYFLSVMAIAASDFHPFIYFRF